MASSAPPAAPAPPAVLGLRSTIGPAGPTPRTPPEALPRAPAPPAPLRDPACEPRFDPGPAPLHPALRASSPPATAAPAVATHPDVSASQPGPRAGPIPPGELAVTPLHGDPASFYLTGLGPQANSQAQPVTSAPRHDQGQLAPEMSAFLGQSFSLGRSSSVTSETATGMFSNLSIDLGLDSLTRRGSAPTFQVSNWGPMAWPGPGGAHHRASLAGPVPTSTDAHRVDTPGVRSDASPPRKKRISSLDHGMAHPAVSVQRPSDAVELVLTSQHLQHGPPTSASTSASMAPPPAYLGPFCSGASGSLVLRSSASAPVGSMKCAAPVPSPLPCAADSYSSQLLGHAYQLNQTSAPAAAPFFPLTSEGSETADMQTVSWGSDTPLDPLSPSTPASRQDRARASSILPTGSTWLPAAAPFGYTASSGSVGMAPFAAQQEAGAGSQPPSSVPGGTAFSFSHVGQWGSGTSKPESELTAPFNPSREAQFPGYFGPSLTTAPLSVDVTERRDSLVPPGPMPLEGPGGSVDIEGAGPLLALSPSQPRDTGAHESLLSAPRAGAEGTHRPHLAPSTWPPLGSPTSGHIPPAPLVPSSRLRTLPARASADHAAHPHVIPFIPRQASLPSYIPMGEFSQPAGLGLGSRETGPTGPTGPAFDPSTGRPGTAHTFSVSVASSAPRDLSLPAVAAMGGPAPHIPTLMLHGGSEHAQMHRSQLPPTPVLPMPPAPPVPSPGSTAPGSVPEGPGLCREGGDKPLSPAATDATTAVSGPSSSFPVSAPVSAPANAPGTALVSSGAGAGAGASAGGKGRKGVFLCDYTHPLTGEVCGTKCNRYYDLARHRESIHAKSEAQLVREARIGLAQCVVLGREVDMHRTLSSGDHVCDGVGGCGTVFSRRDALQRHRRLRKH